MAIAAVVVGTGFGARVHVPALARAGFEVAALVGRDPDRTARRATRLGVPRSSTSLAEALAIPGIELVSIVTPPATHAELAIAAAEAGRHVLCEKPFALDAAQARAVRAAVKRSGVVALVGHEFRFAEDRATIGVELRQGRIGEPRLISLVSFIPLLANPGTATPDWWFDRSRGGGWLGASGSHLVDQVRYWLGEFSEVSASLTVVSDRRGAADDSFAIRFSLANGVQGIAQQSAGTWGPPIDMTRVSGPRGSLWSDGAEAWASDAEGPRRLEVPSDLRLPPAPRPSDDPRHRFSHLELPPYTRLYEVLADLIEGRAPRGPIAPATVDDGVAEMVVLDAIRASAAASGERVSVSAG
jgi:predicted dehydrogenase